MSDCIKKAFVNIFRSRLRSALTISGIAVGVLAVVIISSIGKVGTHTINTELGSMGIDSVMVTSAQQYGTISESEVEIIGEVEGVNSVMPLMSEMSECRLIDTVTRCMVWGVDHNADKIISLESMHGRLVDKGDLLSREPVCVIDESIALEAYERTNVVGKKISVFVGGVYEEFRIIGVAKSGVSTLQNMLGDFIPNFVYIPYTTMQDITGRNGFNQVAVKLEDSSGDSMAPDEISATVLRASGSPGVNVNNLLKQKQQLNSILSIITLVLSLIAGISLLVSGLSIMTVMLTSVSERTREIGIKKSIGATNRAIMMEFIVEATMITLLGSALGIVVGSLLSVFGCVLLGVPILLDFPLILFTLILSLLIGLIFGAYPARKAAGLRPVDALRYE